MRRPIPAALLACLLAASCASTPTSEEETAFLERTAGVVAPGSYPIAHHLKGTDGYRLHFVSDADHDLKTGPGIWVEGLDGRRMPFYASEGKDGKAILISGTATWAYSASKGDSLDLFIIASPEDSVKSILLGGNGHPTVALYAIGDSVTPAEKVVVGMEQEAQLKAVDSSQSDHATLKPR